MKEFCVQEFFTLLNFLFNWLYAPILQNNGVDDYIVIMDIWVERKDLEHIKSVDQDLFLKR